MKCPACDVTLVMADRQGIEIDYCPQCRGVWLDRGELDKIIERTANLAPQPGAAPPARTHAEDRARPAGDHRYGDDRHRRDDEYYRHKKKKNLLGELFDF